jgi:hypothetical protein
MPTSRTASENGDLVLDADREAFRQSLPERLAEVERRSAELHRRLTALRRDALERRRALRQAYAERYTEPGYGIVIDEV